MSGGPDVERFLAGGPDAGYGNGCGDGSGYGCGAGISYGDSCGYGYGYGSGSGSGSGYESGSGSGSSYSPGDSSGSGDGAGNGYDVKSFNGQPVHYVDGIPTIINHVVGFYAKGFILQGDLTLTPIFIARVGDCFAHGETLHEAQAEAMRKDTEARPLEERLATFIERHPHLDVECDGLDLFAWHGILTGSCLQGRKVWCKDHGLDPKATRMTVRKFCRLTMDAYGGDIIGKLLQTMEENAAANDSREA